VTARSGKPAPDLDLSRLDTLPPLAKGAHKKADGVACLMEAVAFVAGERWSDHPTCACPVIGAFLRTWNDDLPDDERDVLLRPLVPLLVGTRSTPAIERRRAMMAADWLIREHTPAWLRLAGLSVQADALAALPEITDFAQCPSLMPVLTAAKNDAAAASAAARDAAWDAARAAARAAARDAAWDAARAAAWDAARDAAWDAARAAARDAAWDAAWDAARAAARDAARDAAWDAARAAASAGARDAAWDAARAAAWDALKPTCLALQQSALAMVHRMIAIGESAA